MNFLLKRIKTLSLGFLIWVIFRVLSLTWRIKVIEPESLQNKIINKIPVIFAHFHRDELALILLARRYRLATMISTSKDGELMTTVFRLMGGIASRGSSTRGGVSALKGLIALCKKGHNSSLAVDGPKGPIYEVKPGVFELSRLLKSEIYPGGVFCDSAWHFPKAWNKTYLPKPFSKIVVFWDQPFGPVTSSEDPRSPELAKTLQNQLFAAQQQAANLFGAKAR